MYLRSVIHIDTYICRSASKLYMCAYFGRVLGPEPVAGKAQLEAERQSVTAEIEQKRSQDWRM